MRRHMVENQKCQLLLWLEEKLYLAPFYQHILSVDSIENAMRNEESMRSM